MMDQEELKGANNITIQAGSQLAGNQSFGANQNANND